MTLLHVPMYFPGLAEAFVAAMRAVRGGGEVSLPDFQHGVGDPVEDAVQLAASHRIVLVEGNYLLLGAHPPPPPLGACAVSAGGSSCGCHVVAAASLLVAAPSLAACSNQGPAAGSVLFIGNKTFQATRAGIVFLKCKQAERAALCAGSCISPTGMHACVGEGEGEGEGGTYLLTRAAILPGVCRRGPMG